MKRIIYTAVALIICASVFGIADYINAKKQGKLVNYSDDVQTGEATISEKKKEITITGKEEILTVNTKKEFKKEMKEKKIVKAKEKEGTRYNEVVPELAATEKPKDPVIEKVNLMDVLLAKTIDKNKSDSIIPKGNKRRINLEMFSRAPIREKRIKK